MAGVDLVIELPAVWASSPAERFASAGVELLSKTGIVSVLSCGSESGNAKALTECAAQLEEAENSLLLRNLLKEGMTYASAREKAMGALFGADRAAFLREPNNILALEYLKAIRKLDQPMHFSTVERLGAGHNSCEASDKTASASLLRKMLGSGDILLQKKAMHFLPENTQTLFQKALDDGQYVSNPSKLDCAVLYTLSERTADELKTLPDISEGLENRFLEAVKTAQSVDELLSMVKTKRYTMSRLRRILYNMMLGNTKALTLTSPPYIRILDFEGERGRYLLKEMKKKSTLPIYHSMAQLERDFPEYAAVEKRATRLFNLSCSSFGQENEYMKFTPYSAKH